MPTHHEKKILPYKKDELFELISDINSYPLFLPWCIGARITEKNEDENIVFADLMIGYKMFREKFSSKVILEYPEKITVEYQSGPMKYLRNYWRLREMPGGHTEIDFFVDFEFKSKVFESLSSMFFHEIVKRMINAFEDRAKEIYKK